MSKRAPTNIDEVRAHVGTPKFVEERDTAFSCVDGRYENGMLSTAGGDMAEFLMALQVRAGAPSRCLIFYASKPSLTRILVTLYNFLAFVSLNTLVSLSPSVFIAHCLLSLIVPHSGRAKRGCRGRLAGGHVAHL